MIIISKEKRIAKKIKKILNERGFIIKMQVSKKSNSVYLILDNGACEIIRISDHKNPKTKCKYNLIKNYHGKRYEICNGQLKKYYNYKNIGKLISDIEMDRSDKIIKHGYTKYKIERNQDYFKKRSINYKNQAA